MVTIAQQIGNTKVTIHSPSRVVTMDADEQRAWIQHQLEIRNPLVTRLVEIVSRIAADSSVNKKGGLSH